VAFNDNIHYRRQLYQQMGCNSFYFTTQPIIDKMFPLSYWNDFFERELTANPTLTVGQLLRAVPGVKFALDRFPFDFINVIASLPDTSPENMLYIDLIFKDWRVAGAGVKPLYYESGQLVRLENSILNLIKQYATQDHFIPGQLAKMIYEIIDGNNNDPDLDNFIQPIVHYYQIIQQDKLAVDPTERAMGEEIERRMHINMLREKLTIERRMHINMLHEKLAIDPVEITPTLIVDPIEQEPKRLRSGKTTNLKSLQPKNR
jgi:hypothetical protein